MKLVVEIHQRGVGVEITHIVACIFGVDSRLVFAEAALPASLGKEIAVPLLLRVLPHVVDDGAGDATVGVVVIDFAIPVRVSNLAEDAGFHAQGMNLSVATRCRSVPGKRAVGHLLAQSELITAVGVGVFRVERNAHSVAEFLLYAEAGIGQSETACAESYIQIGAFAGCEAGMLRGYVHRSGIAEVFGALKNIAFLPVVKGD